MNEELIIVEIPEYKKKKIPKESINDADIKYLKKDCFCFQENLPYSLSRDIDTNEPVLINTHYAGVIQLSKIRIHFSTKVKTQLFYMLSYLKSEEGIRYDSDISIELEEGENFFDVIGNLFLNDLNEIFKKGLLKKYVLKQDNLKFLRGRLLINYQLKNQINMNPKFFCEYDDLTFDNLENQIILRALNLLIPMIRFNEKVKSELIQFENFLKNEISLVDIIPSDCNKICYSSKNEYYKTIIDFSRLILEESFIRSIKGGVSKGFNFIVDMNKLFEDFITELIREVVANDPDFKGYVVESQRRFRSLLQGESKPIITKPDIILKKPISKDEEIYHLIIDAKYKREEKNADYYQIIAYSLAIPTVETSCLIYPKEESIERELILVKDISNPSSSFVKIFSKKIDLFIDEDLNFNEYIKKMKMQIKNSLISCMI